MGCHLLVEGNERGGGQLCSHSQRTLGLMFRVRIRHRLPCQRVRLPGAWVSVRKRVGKTEEREPRLTGLAGLHPTFSDGPRVGGLALVEVPAGWHRQQARRAPTTRRPLPRSPCCWLAAHAGWGTHFASWVRRRVMSTSLSSSCVYTSIAAMRRPCAIPAPTRSPFHPLSLPLSRLFFGWRQAILGAREDDGWSAQGVGADFAGEDVVEGSWQATSCG